MGANFINSCLEKLGQVFKQLVLSSPKLDDQEKDISIIMCILSNYTPECLVRAHVECKVEDLANKKIEQIGMSPARYAWKIEKALRIAQVDMFRATTHNKGIYNGIDAVILATGNDFRAIEAQGHTYAARDGRYRGLSRASVKNGTFRFELEVPIALGTIGGLTSLHPLAKISLRLLGNPSAKELMCIAAAVGLAQNFGAINSLVTTGIQKGHMKMHLANILVGLNASVEEKTEALEYFSEETVSYTAVRNFLSSRRQRQ
jgi:hydroxymethylglutaryl-CoA reductase